MLLLRNEIKSFEYIDYWEKLDKKSKKFFSQLNNQEISDRDYIHVINLCSKFNTKNIGQNLELYNMTDALLPLVVNLSFDKKCVINFL